MAVGSLIAAASGVILFLGWLFDRAERGPLCWAGGNLLLAVGLVLLIIGQTGSEPEVLPIILANIAFAFSAALTWTAARLLNRRRALMSLIPLGPAVWVAVLVVWPVPQFLMALNLAVTAAYLYAAFFEFWRTRSDQLGARWPLLAFIAVHGTIYMFGATEAAFGLIPADAPPPLASMFGLVHFESLIFAIGTAIFVVAFVRERATHHHRTEAGIDPLTGVASRRAFMARAAELLHETLVADAPLSLIVFDLDKFKAINDTFGHAVGDAVLEQFGGVARRVLRAEDLIGRLGGEEFAVVLPATSFGAATTIADRVRTTFAEACNSLDGNAVNATLSGGVAMAHADSTLDSIMLAADGGLYRAKSLGRNRIERADPKRETKPMLSRVA
jgi:diguanylate cyclase (GGDEF)-like protein